MLGKTDKTPQLNMYQVPLIQFIDTSHELCQVTEQIDWDELECDLSDYYCVDNGRPSISIRKIVGVILLSGKKLHRCQEMNELFRTVRFTNINK